MSRHRHVDDPIEELRRDRRAERLLLWKGVFALLVVILVAIVRQRYLV